MSMNPFSADIVEPQSTLYVVLASDDIGKKDIVFKSKEMAEEYAAALNRKELLYSDYSNTRYIVREAVMRYGLGKAAEFPKKLLVYLYMVKYPLETGGWFTTDIQIQRNDDKFDESLFETYKPGLYVNQITHQVVMVLHVPVKPNDNSVNVHHTARKMWDKQLKWLKQHNVTADIYLDMKTAKLKPLGFILTKTGCLIGQHVLYFEE